MASLPATPSFDSRLAKTFRASRYTERMCTAHPDLLEFLRTNCRQRLTAQDIRNMLTGDSASDACDEDAFHARLRSVRRHIMVALIFRDINRLADFAEVVDTISALADAALHAAQQFHTRSVAIKFGLTDASIEQAQLLIVGMGKLGGCELNVSSDIDLIFVHMEDGDATEKRSWHEFHSELGKRIIRALDRVDAHGFVFRVDMRLRPFGASGPLVSSVSSLENYFFTQARPWERYAWLKARAMTGAPATIEALESLVQPFVYRRYHDYAAIEEMRDLHAQIRAEAAKRNRLDDIKVGVGGIREVEFIAQLFQLIRGGRDASLRTRSTRNALSQLEALGILTGDRVAALQSAYVFLRNLEHRLQYLDDQQTQLLPAGDDDRQRIAEAMECADWATLLQMLDLHRAVVTREFESLFAAPVGNGPTVDSTAADTLGERVRHAAAGLGTDTADAAGARVDAWLKSSRTQTLSAKVRARMETLLPLALQAAIHQAPGPEVALKTFFRLFDLLEAIDKRETYLALMVEYPQVLDRVARIAANSAWAAEFLRLHPVLLDELIAPPAKTPGLDWRAERRSLQEACDAAHGDIEKQYELLRHAKQVATLKLNVANIEGRMGVMTLSDELSALADMLLDAAMVLAWRALNPAEAVRGNWLPLNGFAVIGYGKLGSKELGYASDLDLVFLFDPAAGIEGDRQAKLAQRLNSWLNTMTAGGILYETDLRLRPDGAAGMLVSSLQAFREYQATRAWTWEHQALTRARFCAGDASLAAPFEVIRRDVLCQPRDLAKLREEIVGMRDKMRAEKKDRADQLDLKHTRGGIVDVEFLVQYLILAYSREHAEFLGNLGNFALLTRAAALGILDEDLAAKVAKAYLAYRERQHHARTNNESKIWVKPDDLVEERRAVVAAWHNLLGKT
ncbi:MAG: bifunctional [glutamate--ammonia ligase]-adenylyl-L-tyrosine phosphorylase/[glutamate--ammonia-ligase] adenylyltransferase [Betaproteobacteria bacterium]